ncbi:MAG TPA: pyridoxal phosphate-dependent aminotransferase, partial [Longimicrobiaceae bacterium]|nr:pyridoxal phosphate-dependent aminotransferase [Longimicrobiaceae bacterium]
MMAARVLESEYLRWAKLCSHARFNLATSGLANFPLAELPVRLEELELSGPSFYGYEPLQRALAARCGVPVECVVAAVGTSMANHLVMAALLEPGDELLVEHPVYDPLVAVARYLRAEVKWLARRPEDGFRLDPEEVERQIGPRTRLVVLTNLHNPSNVLTGRETLREVGEIARRAGARVLVDEVYLEALFERTPPSAFHLGDPFVVTSSLTKVYGLSGIRCGWILAEPGLAERIWRLVDLFYGIPAHPAERLGVVALAHMDRIAARARGILKPNRRMLNDFLRSRDDLEWLEHDHGTIAFPRLRSGDAGRLVALLRERYETSVVPGSFFGM